MSLANALRGPVGKVVGQFGRPAVLVRRSSGTFDPETGKRARGIEREDVTVVVSAGREAEHRGAGGGTSGFDGAKNHRTATLAANDVSEAPSTDDTLEFPSSGKKDEVWQIVNVRASEESGTDIVYSLDIRR